MTQGGLVRRIQGLGQYKEIWLAGLLCMVLTLIIIPLKPWMIDFFLALNLLMSILIMVTAMYIKRVLDFAVFPAMLLVTTLFRIAISIATARLILSNTPKYYHEAAGWGKAAQIEHAKTAAGHVVKSFGELVAANNAVIGIVMFIIIMVVQFVVVAQGAGRVSEVAARFTLDAMPGKQMAIDAEMQNRVITPEEAKQKREDLERESAFFGAMDGAMKFVKGDAIAGMVIVVVNIIGGLVIGGVMGGMAFGDAASTFTVLTIGQGLLEQIPSLMVAMAAGFLVTRGGTPNNLGAEIGGQLLQNSRSMAISAGILALIGAAPGMPKLAMWSLAAALAVTAYVLAKKKKQLLIDEAGEEIAGEATPQDEISQSMLRTDAISLEVGPELARLADPEVNGELLTRLKDVRRRIAMEFGVIAPGVRVRPHPSLDPGGYQIRVKGDLVAEGHVYTTHVLGIGADLDVPGIDVEHTTDPIYGTPAVWIPEQYANLGAQQGLQVFDAQDVVSTHVAEIVKQHLAELLTREEVAELLNMARQDSPMVVQELVPNMLALGQLRQVLQNLVKEQVPIKDLSTILNALADNAVYTKDPHTLTEHVRAALGRKICARYQSQDGLLRAFMLSPEAERAIQGAIQLNESGQVLMLDPQTSQAIQNNLGQALADNRGAILDPVIITPPKIRRHVKALLERNFSKIVVLSYSEIVAGVQIEPLATIDAHAPAGV
ncbi:MAG: FHIPEP family type III secretion protein [Thermoleophilia bacterium]|nr:FHIPEP family type III secretion protein [Thermoleophilia bacterium]